MEAITKKPIVKKPVVHRPVAAKKLVVHKPVTHKSVVHPPVVHPVIEDKAEPVVEVAAASTLSRRASPIEDGREKPIKVAHGKSFYAVGRRKTSVTQILLTHGNGTITANLLPLDKYFQTDDLRYIALQPLKTVGLEKTLNIKAKLSGGGIHSQAESFRHAVARALIAMNPESRRTLKKLGFLKRDPRVKERKKPGLKRARRAPQFSKR